MGSSGLGWIQNCVVNIDTSKSAVDTTVGWAWVAGITNFMKAGGHVNDEGGAMGDDLRGDTYPYGGQYLVQNYVITDFMSCKRACGQTETQAHNMLFTYAEIRLCPFFLSDVCWQINERTGLPELIKGVYVDAVGASAISDVSLPY
jgi:hypothetical protein